MAAAATSNVMGVKPTVKCHFKDHLGVKPTTGTTLPIGVSDGNPAGNDFSDFADICHYNVWLRRVDDT